MRMTRQISSRPATADNDKKPSPATGLRHQNLLPLGAMVAALALTGNAARAQQPAAAESATLPAIDVKASREQTGYQGTKTQVGKTPQLLRDIPQAVTVVTEQLIQDRNADTL